jgi:peroxiredoxin
MMSAAAFATIVLALATVACNHKGSPLAQPSLSDRVGVLPDLPRAQWVESLPKLAIEARRLPPGPDKAQLVRVLADRASEHQADRGVLQSIADTLVSVIESQPEYARGPYYSPLAKLVHYDHVVAAVDDTRLHTAIEQLEAQDQRRMHADFSLVDIQGRKWTMHDLRGKVVLVNFWTTWCGPCRREMPDMQSLHERFAAQGLVILAISNETQDKVAPFIASKKYTFPALLDGDNEVNRLFTVHGFPQTFVYDRSGNLAAHAIDQQSRAQFLDLLKLAGLGS